MTHKLTSKQKSVLKKMIKELDDNIKKNLDVKQSTEIKKVFESILKKGSYDDLQAHLLNIVSDVHLAK